MCNTCAKKKTLDYLPAEEIFAKILKAHGVAGIQALKLSLWKRGYTKAITARAAVASDFIEESVFGKYTTDCDKLVECIYKEMHKHVPNRLYHHRKLEDELKEEFHKSSIKVDQSSQLIKMNKKEEPSEEIG